ncbi:MAG: hypothetical protein IT289_08570 [Oligoflexia bacterium]|nr:hypothetical protein [Oligoflexia bacterium]
MHRQRLRLSQFVCCSLFLFQPAYGLKQNSFYGGIGLLSHSLGKVANSGSGETVLVGPLYYPLFIQSYFKLSNQWFVGPQLGYTVFGRTSNDGGTKFTYLYLNVPFGKTFGGDDGAFDWNFGPGLWVYTASGGGGTKVLNNGTSTATFGVPGTSQSSKTLSLNGGLGYSLDYFRFGADLILEGFLSNRRSFSVLISISTHLWGT